MGKTGTVSLTDILANFDATTEKVAEEGMPSEEEVEAAAAASAPESAEVPPVEAAPSEEEVEAALVAAGEGVDVGEGSEAALVDAAKAVVEAEAQEELAVESLKAIAKEAQAHEEDALKKEASEFGRLFASEVIDALEQKELSKQAADGAYAATVDALTAEQTADQNVLSKIAEEAFLTTMDKIAEADAAGLETTYNSIVDEAYAMTKQALEDAVTEEQKKRTETGEAVSDTSPVQPKAKVEVSEPDEQEEISEKVAEEVNAAFEEAYAATTKAAEA